MRKLNIKIKGFALFECMLALIIMALIAVAITNYYQSMLNQRKAQQVEFAFRSIFSGVFVYHENEGDWPKNVQDVIDNGYITDKLSKNIWGNSYNYNLDDTHQLIKISTCVPSKGIAANIAAGLPMSQVVDHDKTCAQGVMLVAQMSYFKGSQSLKTYIVEANNIETQKIP
ncbi:MAG: type II secretion system protein, partial [Candidatus Lariskella arthropodorum]